jgi:hypothetical protein
MASRCSRRRQGLRAVVLPRTTRRRSRHPQELGMSAWALPYPRRAALLAGRPALWLSRPWMPRCVPARSFHSGSAATADPAACRSQPPRCSPCPCATEPSPVGRHPKLGRLEIQLGRAWVRYRGPATPETDPPSTFHRPALVPGRHRARSSRPRVTLPRCRPSPWCSPAATPTSLTYPALVPPRPPDPEPSVASAVRVRPGAC